jgi:hypothetical protein
MFLQTIGEEEATGRVAQIYEAQKSQLGFIMATAKCFTTRPDLLPIYTDFSEKIRSGFSLGLREWRLITLIAAKHVPSTYCSHVYGKQLLGDLGSKEAVMAVQRDFRTAGLSDRDVEIAGLCREDRQGCIPDFRSRHRPVAIRRIHGSGDLRYRALRRISLLCQPVLRRSGRRP